MDPERSSAIATVMFTDVEASTEMTTRLGDDAAGRLFATHDRIVRDHVAAHGGRHIRSTGDGFLVLFDSARSAVACALSIEDDLAAHEEGIRVRIGLHAGEVREGEGELFGGAVNLAARVMDRAHGGQILATDAVRQLAGTMPDARFRDRGRVALKGIPERQRVYEIHPGDGRPRRSAARRRRLAALVAAALAVGAVATAVLLAATGGEDAVEVRPNSVAIVDPEDGRVIAQVPVGLRPGDLAVGAGSVWVANHTDNTVMQIGTRSRRVAATISAGINVDGLGAGPSGVWVADAGRSLARVIDPDFRRVTQSLRTFKPLSFGGEVVPSRSVAVTADAVWISGGLSEVARVDPARKRVVTRIPVGNDPSGVAVGLGAVWIADRTDGTVTRIDARTNEVVATIAVGQSASGVAVGARGVWVAVPLEDRVKRTDPASNAIADTVWIGGGPAGVAVGAGGVWVTAARGGTVTRIDPAAARVVRTVAPARAVAAVEAGRADYVSAIPLDRIPALDKRYGPGSAAARAGRQRYFSGASPALHYFALNTRRPLFAGTRMRQAVNAALDRRALARSVQLGELGTPGRPTDQFIPPGLPGFRDAAIYPLGGPDLDRARHLAGGRRRRAVLYTCTLPHCREHSRVLRRNLAPVGIDLEVKNFSLHQMFTRLQRPGEPWDIGYYNWFQDYADPSQFIDPLFTPLGDPNVGRFRDEKIRQRIRAARRLGDAARSRAFAQLDADLARAGAAAPFATAATTDFFSDRIGCQIHQPIYGISLGALCVREQ